jgi:hypothetical protein
LEPVPLDPRFIYRATDCALKLRDAALLVFRVGALSILALEELAHALLKLFLPLRDLHGVDLIVGGDLVDRLDALERFESGAGFEFRAVVSALASHGFHGACSADGRGT